MRAASARRPACPCWTCVGSMRAAAATSAKQEYLRLQSRHQDVDSERPVRASHDTRGRIISNEPAYVRIISSDPISEFEGLTSNRERAVIVLVQQCALGFAQTCIQEIRTINTLIHTRFTLDSHVSITRFARDSHANRSWRDSAASGTRFA